MIAETLRLGAVRACTLAGSIVPCGVLVVNSRALLAAVILALPTPARANDASEVANGVASTRVRFRLHVDTEPLGYTHVAREAAPGRSSIVGFGVGRPRALDHAFVRPVWGLGLGFLFPGERALLGARVAFAVDGAPNESINGITGHVVPYYGWMFRAGRVARPYVEGRLGFGGGRLGESLPAGGRFSVSSVWPTVGAGAGAHFFPFDLLSIDLGVHFDYAAPYVRTTTRFDGATATGSFTRSSNVFHVAVATGFSVWFR